MITFRTFAAVVFVIAPAFSQNPAMVPADRDEIRPTEPLWGSGRLPRPMIADSDGSQPPGAHFDLPSPTITPSSGAPTVSVRQLRHPPSKAAERAFAEAKRDAADGNHGKAIEELRKAVAQSPEFGQAWTNLGVQYLLLGQIEAAIAALEEAARLMQDEALIHTNLSYAYSLSGSWDRAEAEARKAVELDKNYARAHYVLGHLLLLRGVNLAEGVENLRMAREEVPKARLILASYYLHNEQREAAEQELRAYIAGVKGAEKAGAELWLSDLKGHRTAVAPPQ
jgi:tetratricopeptide (TPR) repeat protein